MKWLIRIIKRIRNVFNPIIKVPVKEYGSPGYFKPKWGIIVCHTKKTQGARSSEGGHEYPYCLEMVKGIDLPYETRDIGGVYGAATRLVENYDVTATIEIHYNAFNKRAKGYEMLVQKGDDLSRKYAEIFLDMFQEKFPNRIRRGVKEIKFGGRGYNSLVKAKMGGAKVVILSEMHFGDNPNDYMRPEIQAKFWDEALSK